MSPKKIAGVFDQIVEGLEAGIAHTRGELSLPATRLPSPPPTPAPDRIVRLRNKLKMSQAVFAATLNVSSRTVQSWEQGRRVPSHASARLLQVFAEQPEVVLRIMSNSGKQRHPE